MSVKFFGYVSGTVMIEVEQEESFVDLEIVCREGKVVFQDIEFDVQEVENDSQ